MRRQSYLKSGGFTLAEVLVASGISGVVLLASLIAFVSFQRVAGFCVSTSEVRANQVRLIQALQLDLRHCAKAVFDSAGGVNRLPLTITVPRRYSSFSTSPTKSGEPDTQSTRVEAVVNRNSGKVTIPETVEITYSSSVASNGIQTISRAVRLPSGTTHTRTVATFSSSAIVRFTNANGGLIGTNDSGQPGIKRALLKREFHDLAARGKDRNRQVSVPGR